MKGAGIKSSKEECASSTGQKGNYATMKGAQIKSSKEECAKDTEQTYFSRSFLNPSKYYKVGMTLFFVFKNILLYQSM